MCMHLLRLPLYLIALPFYLLSAIGRGGLCAVSGGGRLWGRRADHPGRQAVYQRGPSQPPVRVPVTQAVPPAAPTRSRFLPGMIAGALCCAIVLTMTMIGFAPSKVVPGIEALAVSDIEINRLIDQVTGHRTSGPLFSGPVLPQLAVAVATPQQPDDDLPPAENALGATEAEAATSAVVLFRGTEPKGRDADELPSWATETEITTFPELTGVITTGPHATIEDAEREALTKLRVTLSELFARTEPAAENWLPPEELVLGAGVVTQRAIERRELKVGDFTEPLFQAYWEVSQPDDLESRLFAAWRPEALRHRLVLLGGGVGLLTLLFGSLAGYFRLDDATQGKYRNKLRVGTGALWALVAAGSALLLVA